MDSKDQREVKIAFVSSSGGHLVQLSRLHRDIKSSNSILVTSSLPPQVPLSMRSVEYRNLPEANQKTPFRVLLLILKCCYLVMRDRPEVVISTGAAPGAIYIIVARILMRSDCVWVDSLANVKKMSLSGRLVKRFCKLWISQWEEVANANGAVYLGKVF